MFLCACYKVGVWASVDINFQFWPRKQVSIYTDFVVLEVLSLRLLTGGEGRGEGEEEEEWAGKSVESVVGPLLVEEPLEVAATAGGECLREGVRERCVCVG